MPGNDKHNIIKKHSSGDAVGYLIRVAFDKMQKSELVMADGIRSDVSESDFSSESDSEVSSDSFCGDDTSAEEMLGMGGVPPEASGDEPDFFAGL